jgi:thiol peroxidase
MTTTVVERAGVTTFLGRPVTLLGEQVKVGAQAPEFTVIGADFAPVHLATSAGTVRLISSVPSLDTDVCDAQTRRFNEEVSALPGVTLLTISADLPFAQHRWCAVAGLEGIRVLSDHRDMSFGLAYGVAVKELRLLARAVFVVDSTDTVVHSEYVPAADQHPDYAAAIQAARNAR